MLDEKGRESKRWHEREREREGGSGIVLQTEFL